MKLRVGGLHLQLLALVILPFSLILLGVALTGISVHRGAMRQLVAERDERSARAAAVAISEQLHHREAAVRGLALQAQALARLPRTLQDSAFLLPDFDGGLAVTDGQGALLASSIPEQIWAGRPLQAWTESLMPGSAGFSDPYVERDENMVMVGARADAVVAVGAFSMRSLLQPAMLSMVVSGGEGSVYLVDSSGRLLSSVGNTPPRQNLLDHPGVRAALRGEIGSHYQEATDGEHVVAFSQVQPTGWALIVEEPWASVASPALEVSLAAPLVLIPALLVTLVGLLFGARQVIRPLRRLQQQADDLADSKYDWVGEPVGGIAEIRQLQSSLSDMAQGIRAAHAALQSYIGAITDAQEEERHKLARELHDTTIQDLIALDHRIQLAQQQALSATAESDAGTRLSELRHAIGRTIQELRRLTGALRPIYLEDLGLVPALQMLAKDAERDMGVTVSLQQEGRPRRLAPEAELAVFRIVQEALSNVGRHAQSGQAELRLTFDQQVLRVEIQDRGLGFTAPRQIAELAAHGHYGLLGMQERAQLVGAQFQLESGPGHGTLISVVLPVQA